MVLREGMLLLFRECTRPTGFDVLDRSRGAPYVVPTAQTAALRCANVAQDLVPLTQEASDCVSWSLTATRLLELGCSMMQLSPCREFSLEHRCSCVGIDISRSMTESNHHHRCFKFSPQVLLLVCTVTFRE